MSLPELGSAPCIHLLLSTSRYAVGMVFSHPHYRLALTGVLFGFGALLLAWITGGLSSSLINPDEGGHYVNALFLGDWIRAGFPAPLAYAEDYYAHFPRLSIGHWPPGWYLIEAPLFATLRPSPAAALMLSAFVAGLPALAIVWALSRLGHAKVGLALATIYSIMPLVIDGDRHILLDQPLALVVALGTMSWAAASERPSWWRFLLFAALAAFAPLVKGNGALIALVPAIDIALTGRWRLLRHPALWVSAALAMLIVAPWYWLSFKISAGGFNYAPGPEYAWLALRTNIAASWANIGAAGLLLALVGLFSVFREHSLLETRIARLSLSVVLATLIFQSLIPAALEPRYLAPMLPWLVVLAGIGLLTLARYRMFPAVGLAILMTIPAVVALWSLAAKTDIGAPRIAKEIVGRGGLWLVDARAGGEGAIIASVAYADDRHHTTWIARASQWLSSSDFMGRDYRLLTKRPEEAKAVMDRIGAAGAVSIADRNRYAYPHSPVLTRAVQNAEFVTGHRPFATGSGTVLLAQRIAPVRPNIALVSRNGGSANVGKMNAMLR